MDQEENDGESKKERSKKLPKKFTFSKEHILKFITSLESEKLELDNILEKSRLFKGLHDCLMICKYSKCRRILNDKVNPKITDDNGYTTTPLQLEILLGRGSNPRIEGKDGNKAIDLALKTNPNRFWYCC